MEIVGEKLVPFSKCSTQVGVGDWFGRALMSPEGNLLSVFVAGCGQDLKD